MSRSTIEETFAGGRRRRRMRDLPLFFKLLLPFLALMVIVGTAGTFLVVRDLSRNAEAVLDHDLARRSIDARTKLRDVELYLLESVTLTSNLKGMSESLRASDSTAVATLLRSVRSLKDSLDLLAVAGRSGTGVVELPPPTATPAHAWSAEGFVATALRDSTGRRSSGFMTVNGRSMLVVAGAICDDPRTCDAAGVAIAGIATNDMAAEAFAAAGSTPNGGLSLYTREGSLLASAGRATAKPPASPGSAAPVRVAVGRGSNEMVTLYSPFQVGGRTEGTLAVTLPSAPVFAAVRGAGLRLALIVLAAMIGVVALGALLSRSILSQVRPLIATNRALGQGILSARAPIRSNDEIGELARGVNQMAEQLQASYETLESTVAQRTEQIRRMLQERTEFFASMSHEFRTPLAVILTSSDLLERYQDRITEEQRAKHFNLIHDQVHHLAHVLDDILTISRAETAGLKLEVTDTSITRDQLTTPGSPVQVTPPLLDEGRCQ